MNTEKGRGSIRHRVIGILICGLLATAVCADPVSPPVSDDIAERKPFTEIAMGSNPEEVQEIFGTPAFAEPPILMYSRHVDVAGGSMVADLTLWFSSNRLFFASYAFPVSGRTEELLSGQFDAISEILFAAYGEPSSRASTAGMFVTEVWNLDSLDVEHTLILETGRTDHVVTLTSAQP